MNKIKLLTPILGLTTLTGVVAPMTSCKKNNGGDKPPEDTIVLDKFFVITGSENGSPVGLKSAKTYNIIAGVTYSLYIDISKITDYVSYLTVDKLYELYFRFVTKDNVSLSSDWADAKGLCIDANNTNASSSKKPLQPVDDLDDVVPGKYCIYNHDDEDDWYIYFGSKNFIKSNPIFEINVTFTEPAKDQSFYFFTA